MPAFANALTYIATKLSKVSALLMMPAFAKASTHVVDGSNQWHSLFLRLAIIQHKNCR
jgi:hypothetical protein